MWPIWISKTMCLVQTACFAEKLCGKTSMWSWEHGGQSCRGMWPSCKRSPRNSNVMNVLDLRIMRLTPKMEVLWKAHPSVYICSVLSLPDGCWKLLVEPDHVPSCWEVPEIGCRFLFSSFRCLALNSCLLCLKTIAQFFKTMAGPYTRLLLHSDWILSLRVGRAASPLASVLDLVTVVLGVSVSLVRSAVGCHWWAPPLHHLLPWLCSQE